MKKIIKSGGMSVFVGGCLAALLAVCFLSSGCWNKKKFPPVVLVIIDTLPAGHCSAYGYHRSTTPTLERLAEAGVRFEHAVAASPWTLPSIASILTGSLPSRHQAGLHLDPWTEKDRRLARMKPGMVTLADLFKEHGYHTAGFFNNPFTHPEFGLNQGFDLYDYVDGDNLRIRRAGRVVLDAISWLEEHKKRPFFMVLHFFDPHLAYDPPLTFAAPYIAGYQGTLSPPFNPDLEKVRSGELALSDEDKKFIVGLYDGEVAAVDSELGKFFDYLRENELYEPALIIVTADHGEEFWEHGGFEHGHSLHREVLEVPLVVKFPWSDYGGTVVKDYVSLMDIYPTVAEFMGWPLPFAIDGVSFYPRAGRFHITPHPVVAENVHYGPEQQTMYAEGKKLVFNLGNGKITVYDLEKDPGENKDIFGEGKLPPSLAEQVKGLARQLKELAEKEPAKQALMDKQTLEKLKSLGYLSP